MRDVQLGICFRKKLPERMRITAYHPIGQIIPDNAVHGIHVSV